MIMYTLENVKVDIQGKQHFNHGGEGEVYRLSDGSVAKIRHRVGGGYNQVKDNLAEVKRYNIHSAVNSAIRHVPLKFRTQNGLDRTARLVDVKAAFVDTNDSVSVMEYVNGRSLDSISYVPGVYEAFQHYGIELDDHGENILTMFFDFGATPDYIVLETLGSISPEILKMLEKISEHERLKILEHIARVELLGATSNYPTVHREMTIEGDFGFYQPCTWRDVEIIFRHIRKTGERRLDRILQSLSEDDLQHLSGGGKDEYAFEFGLRALYQARDVFGGQFNPEQFDWKEGKTLQNYGIDPHIFHQFRLQTDRLKPEVDELKRLAGQPKTSI